jgi:hypothetical protein
MHIHGTATRRACVRYAVCCYCVRACVRACGCVVCSLEDGCVVLYTYICTCMNTKYIVYDVYTIHIIHILRIIYTGIEDGCVVWDLVDGGGENGTFLNGQRVIRARVRWYVPPMYASM